MKLRIFVITVLMTAILIPGRSQAFDDERKGFILGLGAGYGSAKVSTDIGSESWGGVATTFKIGGGPSNQVLVYYSNRVVFFSESGTSFYRGMSAAGVSYFLAPSGPSAFFSAELGFGVLDSFESGIDGDSGFGFTIGAGYELTPHFLLEANYMRASLGDSPFDYTISNFTFTASWLGF